MGLFRPTNEPFTWIRWDDQISKPDRKTGLPAFPKLCKKVGKKNLYAQAMLRDQILTTTNLEATLKEAKADADDSKGIQRIISRGYSNNHFCSDSSMVAFNQNRAMLMDLDQLWDTIFAEDNEWWGTWIFCNCRTGGHFPQWSAYGYYLKKNSVALTTYINKEQPLPLQLDFVGTLMGVMYPAKVVLAFRIALEIATIVDPKIREGQFEKMSQYLFPVEIFRGDPNAYKSSIWLDDHQAGYWGTAGTTKDMALVDHYTLDLDGNYKDMIDEYRKWCIEVGKLMAPAKDSEEYKDFDPAKHIETTYWERLCMPIIRAKRSADQEASRIKKEG